MRWLYCLVLISILASVPGGEALKIMGGDMVRIDSPIADDLFAGGNTVNVNAPVDSAFIAGGNVFINAPIKGDLIVAGGVVDLNSDVGGKVVAAGGTINLAGDVERNVVMAAGQVRILPSARVGIDAAITGADVYHAGDVTGTLWVSAGSFENEGTAGLVKFSIWERDEAADERKPFVSTFTVLMILGFLFVGLLSVRLFPEGFDAVDLEVRRSPGIHLLTGLGLIVASLILIPISILSVLGLPLGLLILALFVAALLVADLFVSFSLGRWIVSYAKRDMGDISSFVSGYAILTVLFLVPYLGSILWIFSTCLGFGGIVAALRGSRRKG